MNISTIKTSLQRLICISLIIGLSAGCARFQTRMMKTELQEVAKRWCLTIRASQVIPVYPLTEDIQPGDIFLVQTPIQDQVSEYTDRGYLNLDIHMHRMLPLDYKPFYSESYLEGSYASVPHPRPRPASPVATPDPPTPAAGAATPDPAPKPPVLRRFEMARLPAAAFPDYGFEVKKGVGGQLAVPISGVPVGMSFMGASSVKGSVKLKEAFTYGLDDTTLLGKLNSWAKEPKIQLMLADIRRSSREPIYLRVVSRVYFVGGVNVSLQAQGATSGGLDVGAAKPINPMSLTKDEADELKSVAAAYKEAAGKFTEALNQSLPGGSVRFATANRNSVVMEEDFGRLLAVGYLGFDVQVDENGNLSAPVATLDILEERPGAEKRLFNSLSAESRDVAERQVRDIYDRILSNPENSSPEFASIRAQFDAFGDSIQIPVDLPNYGQTTNGLPIKEGLIADKIDKNIKGFKRYAKYRGTLKSNLTALNVPTDDQTLKADRTRIDEADKFLTQEFETSDHLALGLDQYFKVLMRRR